MQRLDPGPTRGAILLNLHAIQRGNLRQLRQVGNLARLLQDRRLVGRLDGGLVERLLRSGTPAVAILNSALAAALRCGRSVDCIV